MNAREIDIFADLIADKVAAKIQSAKRKEDSILLSMKELADRTGCKTRTLERWKQQGKIPFHKMGKLVKFRLSEVMEALQTNKAS